MQIGGLALVAGLILLGWGFRSAVGLAAFGAVMLGGGALFGSGVMQWRAYRGRSDGGPAAHRSDDDIEVLVRSMVAVAAADRNLDQDEIAMIQDVSAGLLGEAIPRVRIEQVFKRMQGKNQIEQIARLVRTTTPEGAELAVKGAVWAGRANGALSADELRLVAAIAAALGVSGHRLRTCIAEADHAFDRLAAHDVKETLPQGVGQPPRDG